MSMALGLSVAKGAGAAPLTSSADVPGRVRSSLLLSSESTMPAVPAVIRTGFVFFTGREAALVGEDEGPCAGWGTKFCGPILALHCSGLKPLGFWAVGSLGFGGEVAFRKRISLLAGD